MTDALRARIDAICRPLPGVEVAWVWGGLYETWQVGGRIFAGRGATTPGVAVKCPDVETAQMLIEAGIAARARYFHRSWVLLPESVEEDELAHRIRVSYDVVRAKLPRRVSAGLGQGLPARREA